MLPRHSQARLPHLPQEETESRLAQAVRMKGEARARLKTPQAP